MEQLFTLVFTDLVDSTALNALLGDREMGLLWEAHDAGSRALLTQWRGREIDRSDGFLALFDDTADAAGFMADYHRLLRTLPTPVLARAGIHVGPLLLRHSSRNEVALGARPIEVLGLAKAHCARLMALAPGGHTLISREAARVLSLRSLASISHGHWRLKGIEDPVEIFEVADAGVLQMPPPDGEKAYRVVRVNDQWVALREVPRRLPAEVDGFFGRHRALAELGGAAASGHRLVTITGAGGIGKTRLALRYAWGWLGEYSGGVYFCDLSQAKTADSVASAVARVLQVPLGLEPLAQSADAIHGLGRCLLILDNFEQVVACAAATVGAWMQGAPQAQFIVTSRERLGLPGERALVLNPLETAEAVALFHERARSASSQYRADAGDSVMEPLVRMLDRLPLAIELAAARVTVVQPAGLLALMTDRFRLLGSRAGRNDRQSTLVATLRWSWELLSEVEQVALTQLSVFEGSFPLAAAQSVLDLSHTSEAPWVIDLLQSLIDKSLLRPIGEDRFQFLTCVSEFAAEKLRADDASSGSVMRVFARHHRYYAGLDESAAVAGGCMEVENLVAACRSASEAEEAEYAVATLRLAWLALRLVGPFATAIELVGRVGALTGLSPTDRATVQWVHGAALYVSGATQAARDAVARGISLLTQEAPALLSARLHCALGEICSVQGDTREAAHHLMLAGEFAERDGAGSIRSQVLNAQGALAQDEGRLDDARACYGRAIEAAGRTGDRRWQAAVLGNLAILDMAVSRYDDALAVSQRALEHARAAGDLRWVGNSLCNMGLIYLEKGELPQAQEHLSQALLVAQRLGHRALEFMTLCNLGLVFEKLGELVRACENHRAAVAGAERLGDRRVEAQLRSCLGSALARLGRHDEARVCLKRGFDLLAPTNDDYTRGFVLCSIVENEFLDARPEAAAAALQQVDQVVLACRAEADSELGRRHAEVRALTRD